MNKAIGLQLTVYSLLLGGLSYLVHRLAPTHTLPTLVAGLAGGALCLGWGIRAVAGSRGKALPILTLIPVTYMLLSQTVLGWSSGAEPGRRPAAALLTLLLLLSIAMLMRLVYAGVVFDGPVAGPTKDEGAKSSTAGKPAQANAGKHA